HDPARRAARRARPDPAGPAQGVHALGRRAATARDHPRPRDEPAVPAARRAVHRHRPHRDRRHPGDRGPAEGARHRGADHRPQRARDARHHRSRLHPLRRSHPGLRDRDRARQQLQGPGDLPGREVLAMKLVQRMSQRVVMTPLLQQAIQLLQLSTLELEQVVRKELEENPLLEEIPVENTETAEAPAASTTSADAPAATEAPAPATEVPEQPSKETSSVDGERADDLPFDLSSAIFDDHGDERTPVSMEERDELPFENLGRSDTSLAEHLGEQLRLGTDDKEALRIGEAIIGNLDEDGYLRADVSEI